MSFITLIALSLFILLMFQCADTECNSNNIGQISKQLLIKIFYYLSDITVYSAKRFKEIDWKVGDVMSPPYSH